VAATISAWMKQCCFGDPPFCITAIAFHFGLFCDAASILNFRMDDDLKKCNESALAEITLLYIATFT
jgi:hypothetical protein